MRFEPHLTPLEMLQAGVFGGSYFSDARPEDLEGLSPEVYAIAADQFGRKYDAKLNAYKVRSGDSREEWIKRGLIFPEDPLGWFHWYCRWHAGRQHPRDAHQIGRWCRYGERWAPYARLQVHTRGGASPKVKQSLLHWAYEPMRVLADSY